MLCEDRVRFQLGGCVALIEWSMTKRSWIFALALLFASNLAVA